MLIFHIILAVLSLGLVTKTGIYAPTQKTLIASVISFLGALVSGFFLASPLWTLHSLSMIALYALLYGSLLVVAVRRQNSHAKI